MVQKIETGGTSSTRTPMLKFLMNEWLFDREARHITHCASAESEQSKTHRTTIIPILKIWSNFMSQFLTQGRRTSRLPWLFHFPPSALGGGPYLRFFDRKLS